MGTEHRARVPLSLLLLGRVDIWPSPPAYIPHALWSPAHRAARLLPGAILKLPIWGDPADENCFEDDIYWEVMRGAGGRGEVWGGGRERGGGHKVALSPRGAQGALPQVPEDEESDVYHMHNPAKPASP